MSWREYYENFKKGFAEFVAEHTPTAPTDLSADQKTPDDQGIVPTVETVVPSEYIKTSNKMFGNSNFYSTESTKIKLPEVPHFNDAGLKSDMVGRAEMNDDGTYTDREGHIIMSDEKGYPIMPKDAPKYYSWYKPATKDIGSIFFNELADDWEYRISPDSTIGNDRELTEEDINNGYHLETKLGVQFRVDNLDEIHPDDLPDYLELEDHYSALFSHLEKKFSDAASVMLNNPLAMVPQDSTNPLEFSKGISKADNTMTINTDRLLLANGILPGQAEVVKLSSARTENAFEGSILDKVSDKWREFETWREREKYLHAVEMTKRSLDIFHGITPDHPEYEDILAVSVKEYLRIQEETPSLLVMGAQGPITKYVYISRATSGVVQYAGITNVFARRAAEHLRTKGIDIEPLMSNLSPRDAHAVEQALIEIHGLGSRGGTLMNKINSIAKSNPEYGILVQRGYELLKLIDYGGIIP